jgi:hypothetical protein
VEDESGGQDLDSSSDDIRWLTFAELADELCPQYMSIGVPYSEYWHGDYTQLAHYRKAYELSRDRANHDAWLQGGYIYDALCAVSPMLHAFAKRGTKPAPYHKEPYGMKPSESETSEKPAKTEKEIQEAQATNASARFASFMTQWNKQFESKGGDASGNNN